MVKMAKSQGELIMIIMLMSLHHQPQLKYQQVHPQYCDAQQETLDLLGNGGEQVQHSSQVLVLAGNNQEVLPAGGVVMMMIILLLHMLSLEELTLA
jgi:hypothetical protein